MATGALNERQNSIAAYKATLAMFDRASKPAQGLAQAPNPLSDQRNQSSAPSPAPMPRYVRVPLIGGWDIGSELASQLLVESVDRGRLDAFRWARAAMPSRGTHAAGNQR